MPCSHDVGIGFGQTIGKLLIGKVGKRFHSTLADRLQVSTFTSLDHRFLTTLLELVEFILIFFSFYFLFYTPSVDRLTFRAPCRFDSSFSWLPACGPK